MSTSPYGPDRLGPDDSLAETMAGSHPTPPAGNAAAAAGELVANATIPASSPGPDGSAAAKGFPVLNWERYEFVRLLGRGGMGAVYMARDRRLGRIVALKFLRTEDPLMVQRFQQEARAQASIDHPLICKVFEVGEVEGKAYIAMQTVLGTPYRRGQACETASGEACGTIPLAPRGACMLF